MDDVESNYILPFDRILVTGAHGFVGAHLTSALRRHLRDGARLVTGVRDPVQRAGNDEVELNFADESSIYCAVASVRPDLVVHLAAQSSVGSAGAPMETWLVNLVGTFHLTRAVAAIKPAATVLFTSSAETYGRAFEQGPVTETALVQPVSTYGRSKAAAEALLGDVLPDDARLIIARPGNHSGSGQDERFVIPSFAAQIARIEQGASNVIETGNLNLQRDFLDVRDVVDAYLLLLTRANALPTRSLFNVASGRLVSISTILEGLAARSTVPVTWRVDPARLRQGELAQAGIDASYLREQTNWRPRRTLDDLLDAVLADQRDRLQQTALA